MKKIVLTFNPETDPKKYCEVYRKEGCEYVSASRCDHDCQIIIAYVDKMVDIAVESGFFDDQ